MPVLNAEYHPHLNRLHNMKTTKKEVGEWGIIQGIFHGVVWIVTKDSKGNTTETSEQHCSIDTATDGLTNVKNENH